MSDRIVTVGIWENAPFASSILRGIEKLNIFLKSQNLDVTYKSVRLDSNTLPNLDKTPDILFLDGGEDVEPSLYGEENRYSHFSRARDTAEMNLYKHFVNTGKRVSGVCRGHQLINVAQGGTLWQDIGNQGVVGPTLLDSHKGGHKVSLKRLPKQVSYKDYKKSSRKRGHILSRFVGKNPFTVSSMHHQAVKTLGNGLGVSLTYGNRTKSVKYIVEGIESSNGFIRGIQSHPEFNGYPKDGLMFSYLMHIDNFVDELFEPDMEEIQARLEAEKPRKKNNIPFDMANNVDRLGIRTREELDEREPRRDGRIARTPRTRITAANTWNDANIFVVETEDGGTNG